MSGNPRDMDGFMPLLSTTDIKKKLSIGDLVLNYLGDPDKSIECQDIGLFIDNVIPWLTNGNPKVVQNGLEILTYLADRMGHDFKPYISTVIQPMIDRLGDSKDATREKAHLVLLKILEKGCLTPQQLLDRFRPAFTHKNAKLREEALVLLTTTLNEHGADEMALSGVIPSIVKLLSDPSEKVRETALNTLTDMYRHIGERLRVDLQRKHNVPQAKLLLLIKKFDQLKASGDLLPLAMSSDVGKDTDEPDRMIKSAPSKRTAAPLKRGQFGPAKTPSSALATPIHATVLRATTVSRSMPHRLTSGQAGAVDEETFLTSFEDVLMVNLFSAKDLEEQMKNIKDIIGDDKKDWKQRTESMKKLRAIVLAGGMNYENFLDCLKSIQRPFETACTDLRSQVVREACITLAFLSQHLKTKFASFGESVLLTLMNLIQNSAKVVATAGAVAVRFILQNTHCSRFIPIITSSLNSKSKDIRRASCEYLNSILQTWPTQMLQKHVMVLQEAIKKGIADSDSEARVFARKSYWAFKEHFPEQAEILLNSLDATYKRSLMSLSNSGSINSLNVVTRSTSVSPRASRPALSATGSTENLHQTPGQPHGPLRRTPSLPRSYRQSGIPILQRPTDNHYRVTPGVRSTSAIDLQAAQRAKARLTYGNMSRYKATLHNDHSHQGKQARHSKSPDTAAVASPERTARTRTRVAGVSQSQPSSRSGSPSSRLSYTTYNREGESLMARPRKLSGHGIRSTGNSREPSPQRFGMDRSFASKIRGRSLHMSPTDRPQSRPVLAQKMLQQSREAESALADAFTFDSIDSCYNRATRVKSEHSDDSETSSICSERSMDSFRRPSDDIKEIIENCAHKHWGDRKEGLLGLQHFLANGRTLTASELRKVTDIFTKMFMDSHTKVFSLFLDTLNELITTHNEDLNDWIYVLCARLLNKLGTDLLGSIQAKIHRTLDVVRESFPGEQLLPAVMRYLTDPTQTPNSRVKVASLTFVTQIAETAEPSALNNSAGTALARLLDWTSDVKSQDVRRHAQEAFIALYNLNPPQVTMILAELPKYYQEAALPLVQNYLKSSGSSNPASPGTPPPRAQHSPARNKKNDVDTADENLEEVYKISSYRSLRRTTAEIQNYGFERLERATTSKDSGISNMADLEERIEGLTLSNSGRSSSVSSPTQRGRSVTNITVNGSSDTIAGDLILPQENNGYKNHGSSPDSAKRPEILDNMIKTIQSKLTQTSEKITALQNFQAYVREGDATYVKQNFKKLLKTLLDRVNSDSQQLQIEVLQTLIEMLKCPELLECFSVFPELLVLKVITAHKFDDQKADGTSSGDNVRAPVRMTEAQVLRTAEKCAATIAIALRPEQIILVVSTIITTEPFPLNMGAIKMLHKIVEHWGREAIEPHLSKIMPGLIKAYDDVESTVRKSAVFCMVAIHAAVGEEVLKPHLSSLYASKLKLLYIYIQRAQQTNSQPASPRSNSKN
ncbi:PREDICTED: CLIP-associating protein 1 isoform X9 [Polistes canadensis]|uniref:CLIP-associating protein 1 isoform X9 n=1 Tax=Polistes canadensis TaxID=91411 RepID=UPI000718B7B4|nr:PREDICTED: CLIP-associating protein 1 isoform X9 [Polistes canadensis]